MKINKLYKFLLLIIIPIVLTLLLIKINRIDSYKNIVLTNYKSNEDIELLVEKNMRIEVSNGLTRDELITKINKNLKGVLSNKGEYIVDKCLNLGIDPLLVVSIMVVESGCSYNCSYLARNNYNFGGIKGSNGQYMKYSSVDNGIDSMINVLYYGYISKGATTPESIGPKYAGDSTTWAPSVRSIMRRIKNS